MELDKINYISSWTSIDQILIRTEINKILIILYLQYIQGGERGGEGGKSLINNDIRLVSIVAPPDIINRPYNMSKTNISNRLLQ